MKKEEEIAEKYLSSLSIGHIEYEPDGNIPPDFSINSSIGVEVRRLNQHCFSKDKVEGLEIVSNPLHRTLKKVISSFDNRFDGHSYWVSMIYGRPIHDRNKKIEADMKNALEIFLKGKRDVPCNIKINDSISFDIFQSRLVINRIFRHAGSADWDSGGWLISIYLQNLTHCITEKKNKIKGHQEKYKDWWLLLVDTMGWGLDNCEADEMRKSIGDLGGFNKIIIIDNSGKQCLFELEKNRIT